MAPAAPVTATRIGVALISAREYAKLLSPRKQNAEVGDSWLARKHPLGYTTDMILHRVLAVGVLIAGCLIGSTSIAGDKPRLEANKQRAEVDAMQGKPAPPLKLNYWMNTKPLKPEDLKGKIVVVDFWATWCGPCLKSVPHNNALAKKYADKGVIFLGVCATKGGEKMPATVKQHRIAYPTAVDINGATFAAFKADGYPDYYIIDRDGTLLWGDIVNSDIDKAIELAVNRQP